MDSFRFLLLSGFVALAGCSYTADTSIQDITLQTPGAHDSVCYVYVEGLRYRVYPPNTINIAKSDEDLFIDCLAPGNRRRKVYIEPAIEESFTGNIVTGSVVGVAWDYASKAMFKYPDVIEVSFEGIPTKSEALPAQNNPDIKQPEEYELEEFSPHSPRLNQDRYTPSVEVRRREPSNQGPLGSGYVVKSGTVVQSGPVLEGGAPIVDSGQGDLMDIIDSLSTDINPAGEPNAPVLLVPGE